MFVVVAVALFVCFKKRKTFKRLNAYSPTRKKYRLTHNTFDF